MRRWWAVLVACALVACGIDGDGPAEQVPADELPSELRPQPTAPPVPVATGTAVTRPVGRADGAALPPDS